MKNGITWFGKCKEEGKLTHAVYGAMLKLCGVCDDINNLEAIYANALQAFSDDQNGWGIREFNIAINSFVQCNRADRAFDVFRDTLERVVPDAATFAILLTACDKLDMLPKAIDVFELSAGVRNVTLYNNFMSICSRHGDLARAMRTYRELQSEGLRPDEWTYNVLIDMQSKRASPQSFDDARALFEEMKSMGLRPNKFVFTSLIMCCCRTGSFAIALDLIDQMCSQPGYTSLDIFNGIISSARQMKNPEFANAVLRKMEAVGIRPDAQTYTLLMSVYIKSRQADRVFEIYSQAIKNGVVPNLIMFNVKLEACRLTHRTELALDTFQGIEACGVKPDGVSYETLIGTFCRARQFKQAQLWMQIAESNSIVLQPVTYQRMMLALARSGQWDQAIRLFHQLRSKCSDLPIDTWNTLMKVHALAGKVLRCQEVFDHMVSMNITPNDRTFGAMLLACAIAGDSDRARVVCDTMMASGIPISPEVMLQAEQVSRTVDSPVYPDDLDDRR